MIKTLTIVNGIIQDKEIDGIPVKIDIVEPMGKRNVRTLKKMTECIGITNHNTGNTAPTAGDEMHAKWLQNVENYDELYVSVPLFVDHDSITQVIPLDEVCYHAGDGKGDGNYKTIGVEICENKNYEQAEENAKKLNAALKLTYPHLKIFKHEDWSGKECPRRIISRAHGWTEYVEDIEELCQVNQISFPEELHEWGKEAYAFVVSKGISTGERPGDPPTREEVYVMLHKLFKKIKEEVA